MKPPQKIKRLLRVMVCRQGSEGQAIKLFGQLFPRREETMGCRFTSFFRQIAVLNEKDRSTIETVKRSLLSGKSQVLTFRRETG